MSISEAKDLLLLIWVHGFKGNEVTFESFPDRISHLLRQTHPSLQVVSEVFPAYQTRGELQAATLAFVDWLTTLVVGLENDHGLGGGQGKAKVVLLGHSMGGLLIADAALNIATSSAEVIWPHIVGIVAFDTPYLGLHPHVFKHGLSTAASYYEQAKSVASAVGMLSPMALGLGVGKMNSTAKTEPETNSKPTQSPSKPTKTTSEPTKSPLPKNDPSLSPNSTSTSSWWSKLPTIPLPTPKNSLYSLGAVALGAAAVGTAYYRREDFFNGWNWGYEHMTFVRNLWDEEGIRTRLEDLDKLSKERKVVFRNYYTYLPASPPTNLVPRTFALLPPMTHPLYTRFIAAHNTIAPDEVSAHMGMFGAKGNDGFYDLGLEVVRLLGERLEEEGVGRGVAPLLLDGNDGVKAGWREEKEGERVVWVEE